MRRWLWVLGVLVLVGIGAAIYLLKPVTGPARDLTLLGDVTRGEYLMRLGGCIACHTDIKGKGALLAGGLPLKTPFGSFVPPNITSDTQAGIGSWSLADFASAMSDGVGPGGKHYYPAFPYDNYTLMSDQEIADLYAALMATDPVAQKAAEHQIGFPFNIRLAMLPWKNLFFRPARFEPNPAKSAEWNRGKYLAVGPGHCTACHTPRNLLGAREDDKFLQGGQGTPAGNVPGIDPASLKSAGYQSAADIESVLQGGVTPEFDVPGGAMAEVIGEATTHWTGADLAAISAYLMEGE